MSTAAPEKPARPQAIRPSGFSGDEIPVEVQTLIGELVTRWSYIDFQLKVIVREGFNISHAAALTMLHGKDAVSLWPIINTLTETDHWIRNEYLKSEIRDVAEQAKKKSVNRNDYAHGVFGFRHKAPNRGPLCRYLHRESHHKVQPEFVPISVADLKPLTEQARDIGILAQNATVHLKEWKRSVGLRRPRG